MLGIHLSIICNKLVIYPQAKLVLQKKRKMGEELRKVVREEIDKLLKAQFIMEIRYSTWLPNVVMVKNANGKRCMYIDYTNLNKVFPKDAYPLPSINKLVDGTFGFQLLSFLDAYSGYNQIKMHPPDEEKTAFIMEDINFYYRVMSFGLKNVGATYQRLIGLSLQTTNRMKCQGLCGWHGRQVSQWGPTFSRLRENVRRDPQV